MNFHIGRPIGYFKTLYAIVSLGEGNVLIYIKNNSHNSQELPSTLSTSKYMICNVILVHLDPTEFQNTSSQTGSLTVHWIFDHNDSITNIIRVYY